MNRSTKIGHFLITASENLRTVQFHTTVSGPRGEQRKARVFHHTQVHYRMTGLAEELTEVQ